MILMKVLEMVGESILPLWLDITFNTTIIRQASGLLSANDSNSSFLRTSM